MAGLASQSPTVDTSLVTWASALDTSPPKSIKHRAGKKRQRARLQKDIHLGLETMVFPAAWFVPTKLQSVLCICMGRFNWLWAENSQKNKMLFLY